MTLRQSLRHSTQVDRLLRRVREHGQPSTVVYPVRLGVAAALAFVVAGALGPQPGPPLLAPWTAVFSVYPTVVASVRGGLRRVVALGLGTLVAVGVVAVTGPTPVAVGVVVTAAGMLSRWSRLGEQGLQVPGGAVIVLVMAQSDPLRYLVQFAVEIAAGVGAAMVVNAAIPPLFFMSGRQALGRLRDRISQLLDDIAAEASGKGGHLDWRDWGRRLDAVISEVSSVVAKSQESTRLNLRARGQAAGVPDEASRAFDVLEHVALEARTIARGLVTYDPRDKDMFAVGGAPQHLTNALSEAAEAVRNFAVMGDEQARQAFESHLAAACACLRDLEGEVRLEDSNRESERWSREQAILVALGRLLRELEHSGVKA